MQNPQSDQNRTSRTATGSPETSRAANCIGPSTSVCFTASFVISLSGLKVVFIKTGCYLILCTFIDVIETYYINVNQVNIFTGRREDTGSIDGDVLVW